MPSASSCSTMAVRPVLVTALPVPALRSCTGAEGPIATAGAPAVAGSPAIARQPLVEDLDQLVPGEVRVGGGPPRDEGGVHDDRAHPAEVADVPAVRSGGVPQDVLQGVRGRPHVEVHAHEPGAVLVVVLDAVPRDALPADDAVAHLGVTRKGEAADRIALGG